MAARRGAAARALGPPRRRARGPLGAARPRREGGRRLRPALVLALLAAAAPAASAAALLESAPGRALVQVGGNATLVGDGEARVAPAGAPLGPWLRATGLPLGRGSCERGLCGLVVVEVRGGEAMVVEGTSGVLVLPAEDPEPATAPSVPVPEERPAPLGLLAVLGAVAVAALRR